MQISAENMKIININMSRGVTLCWWLIMKNDYVVFYQALHILNQVLRLVCLTVFSII